MNWIHMALGLVLGFLHSTVKNPASIAKEQAILIEIRDLLNQLIPPTSSSS